MSSFVVFWPHRTHCTDTTCCYGRRTYSCVCLCVFVCLFVGHTDELCKNGWTDRDAVWGADSCRPKELCIDESRDLLTQAKAQFWGLSGPLKSIGSLCCSGKTAKQPDCCSRLQCFRLVGVTIYFSPWKICPLQYSLSSKLFGIISELHTTKWPSVTLLSEVYIDSLEVQREQSGPCMCMCVCVFLSVYVSGQ